MVHQTTFRSYATVAVSTDAERSTVEPPAPSRPNPIDGPYGVDTAEPDASPERYTTFGCVEYPPQE